MRHFFRIIFLAGCIAVLTGASQIRSARSPQGASAAEDIACLKAENGALRKKVEALQSQLSGKNVPSDTWDFLENIEGHPFVSSLRAIHSENGRQEELMADVRKAAPSVPVPYSTVLEDRINYYVNKRLGSFPSILGRYNAYYPTFSAAFKRYGVPEDIIPLCIVESAASPTAVSWAGAAGVWQFMPKTGESYGLRVGEYVDERYDVEKASDAAARYLARAKKNLGRWDLAIMSYNCGAGSVRSAQIKAGGSTDTWEIAEYLPKETQMYLPSFLAVAYILDRKDEYGITARKVSFPKTKTILYPSDKRMEDIARETGMDVETLARLNPQFVAGVVPSLEPVKIKI